MGVLDGQPVSAAVTNPAFLDADSDDTALGKISFNNISDPLVSGPQIVNIQREMNALASWTGKPTNIAYNSTPGWINSQVGNPTDSFFVRIDALTERFSGTTGHAHTGADGEGPMLSGVAITGVPLAGYFLEGVDLIGVTGSSTDVSTQLTGKFPSNSSTTLGVVVNTPFNKVTLRYASGTNQNDQIEDGSGNIVYGRITESSGVWTLSYYVLIGGTETAYSFLLATDVRWYYQELFAPLLSTPVYSELAVIPSDNATADVVDATESVAGKVILANVAPAVIDAFGAKGTSSRVAHQDHTHAGTHSIMIDGDAYQALGDVTFNPGVGIAMSWNSGKLQVALSSPATPQVEYRTITSGEAAAKQLTLSFTPIAANKVIVDMIGVGPQFYSTDFNVSGNVLDWNGLGMDSVPVDSGDKLRIIYWS